MGLRKLKTGVGVLEKCLYPAGVLRSEIPTDELVKGSPIQAPEELNIYSLLIKGVSGTGKTRLACELGSSYALNALSCSVPDVVYFNPRENREELRSVIFSLVGDRMRLMGDEAAHMKVAHIKADSLLKGGLIKRINPAISHSRSYLFRASASIFDGYLFSGQEAEAIPRVFDMIGNGFCPDYRNHMPHLTIWTSEQGDFCERYFDMVIGLESHESHGQLLSVVKSRYQPHRDGPYITSQMRANDKE